MRKIVGIAASSGRVAGRCFRVGSRSPSGESAIDPQPGAIQEDLEAQRFSGARLLVKERLSSHLDESPIFAAHLEILDDISHRVIARIKQGPMDALAAVEETVKEICSLFDGIADDYLRSRSDDIVDVGRQLRFALTSNQENPFSPMEENSILITDNLLVSDTLLIDRQKLAGIALREGSKSSHIAILSRDQGIPLVLGLGGSIDAIPDNEMVIIDGDSGEVFIDPEEEMLADLTVRRGEVEVDREPAITRDGTRVEVLANAGSLEEVKEAIARGADGIGLLRTEFIFMRGSDFPDEEQQHAIYLACARACNGKSITLRTLDI
ncbi:MAG: putative PEP-binding protein, partial [Proteiniphilum sp.]